MMCDADWEPRHPLDFYKTKNDTHVLPFLRSDSNTPDVGIAINSVTATNTPPNYSPEVLQFFNRLSVQPISTRKTLYASLIDTLVAGGVWNHLDVLNIFATENRSSALVNLRTDDVNATEILHPITHIEPTFTVNSGFISPVGTGVQWNMGTNTSGRVTTTNRTSIGGWVLGNATDGGYLISSEQAFTDTLALWPRSADDNLYYAVNTTLGAIVSLGVSPTAAGFWYADRTTSNLQHLYHNTTLISSNSVVSQTNPDISIQSGMTANTVAVVFIGDPLDTTQRGILYSSLNTYLTAVGAI